MNKRVLAPVLIILLITVLVIVGYMVVKKNNFQTYLTSSVNQMPIVYKSGSLKSITFQKKLLDSFDNTDLILLTQQLSSQYPKFMPQDGFYITTALIPNVTEINGTSTNKVFYLITIMNSKTHLQESAPFMAIDNEGNLYFVSFGQD